MGGRGQVEGLELGAGPLVAGVGLRGAEDDDARPDLLRVAARHRSGAGEGPREGEVSSPMPPPRQSGWRRAEDAEREEGWIELGVLLVSPLYNWLGLALV